MADDTPKKVESPNEKFPTTARDETEDLYNPGVTTCIVEVRCAYGTTTLKRCSVLSNVIAVKSVRGVPEHTPALCAINTLNISDSPKEKGARAPGVDTDGEDHC